MNEHAPYSHERYQQAVTEARERHANGEGPLLPNLGALDDALFRTRLRADNEMVIEHQRAEQRDIHDQYLAERDVLAAMLAERVVEGMERDATEPVRTVSSEAPVIDAEQPR